MKWLAKRAAAQQGGGKLPNLASLHGADKWGLHWYARHYETHFRHFRNRRMNVLEIGIGGYADPDLGGASLRMWRDYFTRATIVGIDIHDKLGLAEDRIRIFRGSQDDPAFLRRVSEEVGGFTLVIDDGSHISAHVRTSFQVLFPVLADDGIYAVEDLQASYWAAHGGANDPDDDKETSMGFFKRLADGLNFREYDQPGYQPTYEDLNVVALYFYHNLVFVQKGRNDELSNIVVDNVFPR